jgi:hypothetical protein
MADAQVQAPGAAAVHRAADSFTTVPRGAGMPATPAPSGEMFLSRGQLRRPLRFTALNQWLARWTGDRKSCQEGGGLWMDCGPNVETEA